MHQFEWHQHHNQPNLSRHDVPYSRHLLSQPAQGQHHFPVGGHVTQPRKLPAIALQRMTDVSPNMSQNTLPFKNIGRGAGKDSISIGGTGLGFPRPTDQDLSSYDRFDPHAGQTSPRKRQNYPKSQASFHSEGPDKEMNPDPIPFISSDFKPPPLERVRVNGKPLPGLEANKHTESEQNTARTPFTKHKSRSSTVIKKVGLNQRHTDMWGSGADLNKTKGVAFHTERYGIEEMQRGSPDFSPIIGTNPHPRVSPTRAETNIEFMSRMRSRKKAQSHNREALNWVMGGQQVALFERSDIQDELRKLKSIVLPTKAKDLYVGRGFRMPEAHAINKPRPPRYNVQNTPEQANEPATVSAPASAMAKASKIHSSHRNNRQPRTKTSPIKKSKTTLDKFVPKTKTSLNVMLGKEKTSRNLNHSKPPPIKQVQPQIAKPAEEIDQSKPMPELLTNQNLPTKPSIPSPRVVSDNTEESAELEKTLSVESLGKKDIISKIFAMQSARRRSSGTSPSGLMSKAIFRLPKQDVVNNSNNNSNNNNNSQPSVKRPANGLKPDYYANRTVKVDSGWSKTEVGNNEPDEELSDSISDEEEREDSHRENTPNPDQKTPTPEPSGNAVIISREPTLEMGTDPMNKPASTRSASPNPLKGGVVENFVESSEFEKLRKSFKRLDTDMDGHLQFVQLKSQLPKGLTHAQERYIKVVYDITEKNTFFGLNEYICMSIMTTRISSLQGATKEAFLKINFATISSTIKQYVELFDSMDRSNAGKITVESLKQVLSTALESSLSDSFFKGILQQMQISGEINKMDFLAFVPYFISQESLAVQST